MKPAVPDLVIFDMDDVLCRYDLGKRLRVLSRFSGRSPRDIRAAIWDSGFEDDSDAGCIGEDFYCCCELKARKPDPAAYLRLLERLKVDAGRCLFIDDKRSNVEGAVMAELHGHHFTSRQCLEREARSLGLVD
jgi:FMN phosphatase YigB (HAD superfamily)